MKDRGRRGDWKDAIPFARKGNGAQSGTASCGSCGGCSCNSPEQHKSQTQLKIKSTTTA